jgi:hypothetical protein
LTRDQQHLLDFGQRGLVAAARHLVIQGFDRDALVLRFGIFAFQQTEFAAEFAHLLLVLRHQQAIALVLGFHFGQTLRYLLLRLVELGMRIQPLPDKDHHQYR